MHHRFIRFRKIDTPSLSESLEIPDGGNILFNGVSLTIEKVKLNELRTKIGMVFQSFNLFNNLNVLDNVMLAQTTVLKRTKEEAKQIAIANLKKSEWMTSCKEARKPYPGDKNSG